MPWARDEARSIARHALLSFKQAFKNHHTHRSAWAGPVWAGSVQKVPEGDLDQSSGLCADHPGWTRTFLYSLEFLILLLKAGIVN